ncbi:hypothetical protein AVHY2522_23665 [Acidovorax sp. SUPP2522]|uniref:hypothetical protein n=1 Tax=unclassified Acidovorax TaxID=2684926 RepID=UPI00234BB0F6|nr:MULTISPECIES: hypothetical protein [unclassified Acidovorax]WCM99940.1 hypothetical protein M5C96_11380 [Acidovorax sp. GBBC 1281]GKT19760.1 hypothetical protein AVHY2522_23665 [Acidovorax sp. SUPP2522]
MTNNPFKAGAYDGVPTYHVTADDRLRLVGSFERAQCDAALLVPGLQKTVASAVHRRIRHLDRVATVVAFEDHGQDFLRWELDANGTVIGCEPFQASIWCGNVVIDHEKLVVGRHAALQDPW